MNIKDLQASLPYLFKAQLTAFIWGHAGIGKSSVVKAYAKNIGYHFFPLYLGTQADLGDILGLQEFIRDEKGNPIATTFAMPVWLKDAIMYCENNPDSGAIIFLDELNRGRRDILNGMFSLALDKTFHTIKLPANCHIIAAGNPPTDEYYTTDVNETALMARFVHIKLEPSFQEWVDYARTSEIETSLVGFLQEQPELLEEKRSNFELPVKVDRRSFDKINKLFKLKTPTHILEQLMVGIIGIERVVAYKTFLENQDRPFTAEEILTGKLEKMEKLNKKGDVKSSLLSISCDNMRDYFLELDKTSAFLTESQKENLMKFIRSIPKDLAFVLIQSLLHKDSKSFREFAMAEKDENGKIVKESKYESELCKISAAAIGKK